MLMPRSFSRPCPRGEGWSARSPGACRSGRAVPLATVGRCGLGTMLPRARGRRCRPGSSAPLARVGRCELGTMLSRARGRRWRPGSAPPLARVGRCGLGTMLPRARGGRGGLGAPRPSKSRRRPPKPAPRRLARGRPSTRRPRWSLPIARAPVTSPVAGDVAASGGADAASLPVPPLPRGREVDVTDRISRRPFAREVDAAQPQLSPLRAIEGLSNNLRGRTLAFSRGRRILHANAGKIR